MTGKGKKKKKECLLHARLLLIIYTRIILLNPHNHSMTGIGKLSIKSQVVNILDFVIQEAKLRLLCRYLCNKKNFCKICIDEFQNIIIDTIFCNANVTGQDPMGPSLDRPLPHILCFRSSLKYLDNSI